MHVRLLSHGIATLAIRRRLNMPWQVTVTFSDPDNPHTTFALQLMEDILPLETSVYFSTRVSDEALAAVRERYREEPHRGIVFEEVAGGVRLVTRPALHGALRKFFEITGRSRLSMAALETLAIVAYRQPVTGPEIQDLRGVNSSGVLRTLLERRLIRIAGRKPVVGKPFLYRTTRDFLMHFGLQSLDDLPPLEEFEELMGEAESVPQDPAPQDPEP